MPLGLFTIYPVAPHYYVHTHTNTHHSSVESACTTRKNTQNCCTCVFGGAPQTASSAQKKHNYRHSAVWESSHMCHGPMCGATSRWWQEERAPDIDLFYCATSRWRRRRRVVCALCVCVGVSSKCVATLCTRECAFALVWRRLRKLGSALVWCLKCCKNYEQRKYWELTQNYHNKQSRLPTIIIPKACGSSQIPDGDYDWRHASGTNCQSGASKTKHVWPLYGIILRVARCELRQTS